MDPTQLTKKRKSAECGKRPKVGRVPEGFPRAKIVVPTDRQLGTRERTLFCTGHQPTSQRILPDKNPPCLFTKRIDINLRKLTQVAALPTYLSPSAALCCVRSYGSLARDLVIHSCTLRLQCFLLESPSCTPWRIVGTRTTRTCGHTAPY